jgi:hypothetical protein
VRHSSAATALHQDEEAIAELVERLKPVTARAVDRFELAAALESNGITDSAAQFRFGCPDVFVLADEVLRRTAPQSRPHSAPVATHSSSAADLRDIGHGLLYLSPVAIFPLVFDLLGYTGLLFSLVVLGGLGWVWAGGSSWIAYRLLGRGLSGLAAAFLRRSALLGPVVGGVVSVVLVEATGAEPGLVVLGVVLMAFQMTSTLLMLYRREELLLLAMAPAVVASLAYLAGLLPMPVALVTILASLASAFWCAVGQTRGRGAGLMTRVRDGLHGELGLFPLILLHAGLSALFLLYAQFRFARGELVVLVAFLPLFAAMGVVEWRARRFAEGARALLTRAACPTEYAAHVRLLLARDLGLCVTAVLIPALLLLGSLAAAQMLRPAAVVLAAACALLAAAYLIGFLLANMGRYGLLCLCLALCSGVQIGLFRSLAPANAMVEASIFTAGAALLFLSFFVVLVGPLSQARTFKSI